MYLVFLYKWICVLRQFCLLFPTRYSVLDDLLSFLSYGCFCVAHFKNSDFWNFLLLSQLVTCDHDVVFLRRLIRCKLHVIASLLTKGWASNSSWSLWNCCSKFASQKSTFFQLSFFNLCWSRYFLVFRPSPRLENPPVHSWSVTGAIYKVSLWSLLSQTHSCYQK